MTNIVFFGTSAFSRSILQTLCDSKDHTVSLVVTQPDKPVGRSAVVTESPVSEYALSKNLQVYKPNSLKADEVQQKIQSVQPDIFVVISYGKIIPQAILDIPKQGAINIHPSLLPQYRGATPIHAALLNGNSKTGVSIMLMDSSMDHGPLLAQKEVVIDPRDMFPDLEQKLCEVSQKLILETIPLYLDKQIFPLEQNHDSATFTQLISKNDGRIDWSMPAEEIFNKYRAFCIWPGIWTTWKGKIVKLSRIELSGNSSELAQKSHLSCGTVFLDGKNICVSTQEGFITILEIQPEGKQKMPIEAFINGQKNFVGSVLGLD